jgi:hypothetical protein
MDFARQKAEFVLDVCIGDPDAPPGPARERRRPGRLELTGVQYLFVDRPDPRYQYHFHAPVDIDPCEADPDVLAKYPARDGVFAARFFVSDWNGFINFAAKDAGLRWLDPTHEH